MEPTSSDRVGTLPVTAARARLFELVEDVLTGRASRVELSHRGYEEHVLLIRQSEIEGLEGARISSGHSRPGDRGGDRGSAGPG
jgi:hypothetical protein